MSTRTAIIAMALTVTVLAACSAASGRVTDPPTATPTASPTASPTPEPTQEPDPTTSPDVPEVHVMTSDMTPNDDGWWEADFDLDSVAYRIDWTATAASGCGVNVTIGGAEALDEVFAKGKHSGKQVVTQVTPDTYTVEVDSACKDWTVTLTGLIK